MVEIDWSSAPWIRSLGITDPFGPNDVPYKPCDKGLCERPLMDIIGDVAREKPHRIAVQDGSLCLTYAQLYAMACRLSHEIARAGLAPGAIGVMVRYDALYCIAVLGCLAAGRPLLVLSPDSPQAYNRRIIEAAKLRAVLVNEGDGQAALEPDGPPLIAVEPALRTDGDDRVPAGRLGPDEPAFIVSTSGTTGAPKLVVNTQRRAHLRIVEVVDAGHFNEHDRFLTLGSPVTGATLSRNLMPLTIGASVQITDLARSGLGDVLKTIRDFRVTVLRTTVSIMKSLSQLPDARSHLTSLRLVWITGEAFLQKDLTRMRDALPASCRLGYALSMTESVVARWHVPDKDDHDPVRVASGYLLPGIEALVVDEDGRPCALGEVGELVVRGEAVASGEWVDGRMVAGRFARDPGNSRQRVFRTGDLVRICDDGVFVVHGRKDRMIKLRGHRVEPAVIEAAIRDVAGVADAAVAATDTDGSMRIYGFVVPVPPARPGLVASIQEALRAQLPSYMSSFEIVTVDALPTSTGGKIDLAALLKSVRHTDRKALPAGIQSAPTASERAFDLVAESWRTVLRRSTPDASLSFEAAGGDSLLFMQMVFRLEQLTGLVIPLVTFDMTMTQADMARKLDDLVMGVRESKPQGEMVFLLPGVGGNEPRLLRFRAGCAPELSVHCLEYGDWTEWVEPGFDFEQVIDRLMREIQSLAPAGKFHVAGYSLGGRISFVIAARLRAAGCQVENLLVLDAAPVITGKDAAREPQRGPLTLRREFKDWWRAHRRGEGAFVLANIVTRRLLGPRRAPLLRWLARHRRTVLRGRLDFYLSYHLDQALFDQHVQEWRRRLPTMPALSLPTTLFVVKDRARSARLVEGWAACSTALSVVEVGGDHHTMFDPPHLEDLCARFREACGLSTVEKQAAS